MKTTVIHHSADFDGLFCREIARKFLPDATLIGWDYGDLKIPFPVEGTVYVMDLSPECFDGDYDPSRLIWIDHHKSAIEKFTPRITGYTLDGVAACRLAWQWFSLAEKSHNEGDGAKNPNGGFYCLPTKQEFIDRKVSEPRAVTLAGEYDIWDKRDPDVDIFQLGLRSRELSAFDWSEMLSMKRPSIDEIESLISVGHDKNLINPDGTSTPAVVWQLLDSGRMLKSYVNRRDAGIVEALGFPVEFEGVKFLALNSAGKGSLQFAAKDYTEYGHDALLKFNYTGTHWDVSLYHAKHRTDLDLSAIAVKYGGGGHRGACGFRAEKLPFLK